MRLTQRRGQVIDLRCELLLPAGRARRPARFQASRNWRFQFQTDCSDTLAWRAASAIVTSPASTMITTPI